MTEIDYFDRFLDLEKDNNLFEWTHNEIKIWQYVRFGIIGDVRSVIFNDYRTFNEAVCSYSGKMTLPVLLDKFLRRNDRFIHHKEILLITHTRKKKIGTELYRDSYVFFLDKYLKLSHVILDINPFDGDYVRQPSKCIITKDLMKYIRRNGIRIPNQAISKEELEKIIIRPIEETFNIDIPTDLKNRWMGMVNHVLNYKPLYESYYEYLLDRIKPKIILLPNGYSADNQFLYPVARNKGIPTVELEHGIVTATYVAYNFYKKMQLDGFPDYFFSFGNYEVNSARWPIEKDRIVPVGYPELEYSVNEYQKDKVDGIKTIVFISSEIRELDDFILELASMLDTKINHIIYRLHPKEVNHYKTEIGLKFTGTDVEVTNNLEKSLYECLGVADWVVGMSSTALYEATAFDAKVAIIDHPLSVHSEALYESGKALLVKSANDLARHITRDDFIPDNSITFFEKNSLQNMEYHIERIIRENQKKQTGDL